MLHNVALIVLSYMKSESPNITERLRLKRGLGCRNFHWYLTTVYPQLYIPQDRPALSGEVENTRTHTQTQTNMTFTAHCWHNRLTRSIRSCSKLYNVGTGSCADYPRGQDLQDGAMSIAPCTGTGSQVTMTTVVKVDVWLHTVAQTTSLVIAALWSKLWAGGALGSDGGSVLWRQRREGGPVSVSQAATNHQQTAVEVHKGKAEDETFKCVLSCWEFGWLSVSVLCLSWAVNSSTSSPSCVWRLWKKKGSRKAARKTSAPTQEVSSCAPATITPDSSGILSS